MSNKSLHRSDFSEAMVNSGFMFLFMTVFSILGIMFMFASLNPWVEMFIGLAFSVPLMMIYFYNGKQEGVREFKKINGITSDTAARGKALVPSIFKGLLYVTPYALISIFLAGLCWMVDNQALKIVVLVLYMPAALLGQSFGLIEYPHKVVYDEGLATEYTVIEGVTLGGNVFIVILTFVLIACLIFWIAYIIKINKSKETFNSFMTEIFENTKLTR